MNTYQNNVFVDSDKAISSVHTKRQIGLSYRVTRAYVLGLYSKEFISQDKNIFN